MSSVPAPPRPGREPHGTWVRHAATVSTLVKAGWQISDAVRNVIHTAKLKDEPKTFNGIRAAYYSQNKFKI